MYKNKFMAMMVALLFFSAAALAGTGPMTETGPAGATCMLTHNPDLDAVNVEPVATLPIPQRKLQHPFAGRFNPAVITPLLGNTTFIHVGEMLRGRVPGLWVTGSFDNYQIRIRGAFRPPLIVIDGVWLNSENDEEVNMSLQMVNPAEVVAIEVLRSLADTNIYGTRGANGVIVIHTQASALR